MRVTLNLSYRSMRHAYARILTLFCGVLGLSYLVSLNRPTKPGKKLFILDEAQLPTAESGQRWMSDKFVCTQDWANSRNVWILNIEPESFEPSAQTLCAIESYASKMPNWCIRYLIVTDRAEFKNASERSFGQIFGDRFDNIEVVQKPLSTLLNDSKAMSKLSKVDQNKFLLPHLSDVLRLVLLYNYGGIYSDWDVILVRKIPMTDRESAFVVRNPDGTMFSSSFMMFPQNHPLLASMIESQFVSYNPTIYLSLLRSFQAQMASFCLENCAAEPLLVRRSTETFRCCDVRILAAHGQCIQTNPSESCRFYHYTSSRNVIVDNRRKTKLDLQTSDTITAQLARRSCPVTTRKLRYFLNQSM